MTKRSLLSVLFLLLCGTGTGPAFCSGHRLTGTETSYETATSAADGSYRIENVGHGRITLRATAPGYESLERETELDSAETWLDLFLDVPDAP